MPDLNAPLPTWTQPPQNTTGEILRVSAGMVSMLSWHRNAWKGMIGQAAFYLTPEAARAGAERGRVQGTYFKLREVPAMRLDAPGRSLIVANYLDSAAFSSWATGRTDVEEGFRCGLTMPIALMNLSEKNYSAWKAHKAGVVMLDIDKQLPLMPPPSMGTRAWLSISDGAGALVWISKDDDGFTSAELNRWARRFIEQSGPQTLLAGRRELRAAGLVTRMTQSRFESDYR